MTQATRAPATLDDALRVLRAASTGDLEPRVIGIDPDDPNAPLLNAINGVIDVFDAYVRESMASAEAVSQRIYYRKMLLTGLSGTVLDAARTINRSTASTQTLIQSFQRVMQDFEENMSDVGAHVATASRRVGETSRELAVVANDTSMSALHMTSFIEQTSAQANTVASATEELSAGGDEIQRQLALAEQVAIDAERRVSDAEAGMRELLDAAETIQTVVSMVASIAANTNLLALNAAIAAASAGVAGRRFSVVASEVKELAGKTADATRSIRERADHIRANATTMASTLKDVHKTINGLNTITSTVAGTLQEHQLATREITVSIQMISDASSELAGDMVKVNDQARQTSDRAAAMKDVGAELNEASSRMDVEVSAFLAAARKVVG